MCCCCRPKCMRKFLTHFNLENRVSKMKFKTKKHTTVTIKSIVFNFYFLENSKNVLNFMEFAKTFAEFFNFSGFYLHVKFVFGHTIFAV